MSAGAPSRPRRLARALARAAVLLPLGACVTTYEPAPLFLHQPDQDKPAIAAVPLAIPFPKSDGTPEGIARAEFYRNVLQRMHDATKEVVVLPDGRRVEGDVGQLEGLLAAYERPDLPPEIAGRVAGFRAVARGMRFTQHAAKNATLALVDPVNGEAVTAMPPLGAQLALEVRLPAGADEFVLGGQDDDDPLGFLVVIVVDDTFVDGGKKSWTKPAFAQLSRRFELRGDAVLRLPVAAEIDGGDAVRRDVRVRVELMPGYVRQGDVRAPVQRTLLASSAFTQWPLGYDAVAKAPLASLQAALRNFERASFRRVYLAAVSVPPEERDAAIRLLIEQVRFGRPDQAQVAMAALRAVTGAEIAIGDRDRWLAWDLARR